MPGRIPGPIGLDSTHTPHIDSGTAVRTQSPRPGGVGGAQAQTPGSYDVELHEVSWIDTADAAEAIWDALCASRLLVGPIVYEMTGVMLGNILAGLVPGLMMAIGVMAGTTLLGAGVGALIGALAGGVGAAPGAILGGELGYNLGMAAMAMLGLGFLASSIVEGLPELKLHAERATRRAVNSLYVPAYRKRSEIHLAAQDYAMAMAVLLKLVLMSLVALLLKRPTAASVKNLAASGSRAAGAVRAGETVAAAEAGVAEIVAQLRASRLGAGFASWVEAHWRELIENPKLRPQPRRAAGGGTSTSSAAATPSQATGRSAPKEPTQRPASTPPATGGVQYKQGHSEAEIMAISKGRRPDPDTYLKPEYVQQHLDTFQKEGGGFFFTSDDIANPMYSSFNPKKFVMSGSDLDAVMARYKATGDVATLETALGYDPGSLAGKKIYMMKMDAPKVVMPTGNEGGANLLWRPGGLTHPGGMKEAVLDNVPIRHNNDLGTLMKNFQVTEVN